MTSSNPAEIGTGMYDVEAVRADFPILSRTMHDKPLAFLDSAASAQKPRQVIDAVSDVYEREYANVHRGLYQISEAVTARYEGTRDIIRDFIGAAHSHEIIFTRNATESINLIAYSFGRNFLNEGDEVVITELEHHANIVPWQMLRDEKGIVLKVAPITDDGELIMSAFEDLLGPKTKLVAVAQMSNVLGTILPIEDIIHRAHAVGAKVLIDGCQAVTHFPVDVQALGCDFYVFSGHKLYGPSGSGAIYVKKERMDEMRPFMGGGDMIRDVSKDVITYNTGPMKFEAGTPGIVQTIGLGAALEYLMELGMDKVAAHEAELAKYAREKLTGLNWLGLQGTTPDKAAIFSFTMEGAAHAHDISTILDKKGVAVRAGHHCAQPLMQHMGVNATCRASFGLYNTKDEVDVLVDALELAHNLLG